MPGAASRNASANEIAIYHYATKSLEDFGAKMLRGSSLSKRTHKEWTYFADIARCALAFHPSSTQAHA